jgi:hypothetical protein
MRRVGSRRIGLAVSSGLSLLLPVLAHAVDAYEIQVYDGTANEPGVPGAELHANSVPSGRKTFEPPELPSHAQSHFTLEPSFGITSWWEAGAYFQTTLREDGVFTYAGVKVRSKFVTPAGWDRKWRLGVNFEVSRLPEVYDRDRWGTEVRPIAAWEDRRWLLAVNPILDASLAGAGAADGLAFEPALMIKIKIEGKAALGIEYYANVGPIAHPLSWNDQEHYLYEAFDLLSVERLELNAGIGEGFTGASNALVLKVIVGYKLDAPEGEGHGHGHGHGEWVWGSSKRDPRGGL